MESGHADSTCATPQGEARRDDAHRMLIVLSVLSIIGGVAVTRLNTVAFKMDAAARVAHTAVQQAQRLALTRQFDVIVSFDQPDAPHPHWRGREQRWPVGA